MNQVNSRTVPMARLGGLGIENAMTAEEALKAHGLDWTVSKRQVTYPVVSENNKTVPFPDRFVIARDDNDAPLGVATGVYQILQNKTVFSFMDAIVQEKMATFDQVLSLRQGRRLVVTARLPESVSVLGKDKIDTYFLLSTTHDGTGATCGMMLPKRLFCANQLPGLAGKYSFNIKHTISLIGKVDIVRRALGIAKQSLDGLLNKAETMARKQYNMVIVSQFLEGIGLKKEEKESTRKQNIRDNILNLAEFGYGNDIPGIKGSLWALYNGVTQHVDHKVPKKLETDGELASNVDSLLFGSGARLKEQALKVALELSK